VAEVNVDTAISVEHGDPPTREIPQQLRDAVALSGDLAGALFLVGPEQKAEVMRGVEVMASDAIFYDSSDAWAKIPFKVVVYSRVTLHCEQSDPVLKFAAEVAHDFAWRHAHAAMGATIARTVHEIRTNWYKGYFEDA
jgi:hypothetical protein